MQLRYVFSELRQGLRRNLSMHIAVVLTMFVSLTLVGLGVLLNQQANRIEERYGNEFQITVFLCRDGDAQPACASEVTETQVAAIEEVIEKSPEVESARFESSEEAFEKVKELYGFPDEYFEGKDAVLTADDMAKSIWITLRDPQEYEGITSAVEGLDGVSTINDQRDLVRPIFRVVDGFQVGSLLIAAFLVVAALLLVANTIRLAAFARRKEIGIMRLVGASTLYITLPFLLEAIVIAAISLSLAAGALTALQHFGVEERLRASTAFIPWVGWGELATAVVAVAALAPVLTLLPTLLLTRKYLKV